MTCEIKGRDLDSRLLIAAHLVKRGYYAVVGQYWGLGQNAGPALKGIYHFKTANQFQAIGMATCKGHGHAVVASDEEVLGASEAVAASSTDPVTFEHCDRYFAFNESHKSALVKAFPRARDRIRVTGSSRGDLLRASVYARPHPRPYILVNTSFGVVNSIWGDLQRAIEIYVMGIPRAMPREEADAIIRARIDYETAALRETEALVEWLTRWSEYDIVIRPHPGEKAERWREFESRQPRVRVVTGSDPYQWTKHAALMIHNDSTLGVEVTLLGTPSLNLSPREEFARRLVLRDINFTVFSAAGAYDPITRFLNSGDGPIAAPYPANIFPPQSAETTARELAELLPAPMRLSGMPWATGTRNETERGKFTVTPDEFRQAIARVFPIAGSPRADVMDLDDSVILLLPGTTR